MENGIEILMGNFLVFVVVWLLEEGDTTRSDPARWDSSSPISLLLSFGSGRQDSITPSQSQFLLFLLLLLLLLLFLLLPELFVPFVLSYSTSIDNYRPDSTNQQLTNEKPTQTKHKRNQTIFLSVFWISVSSLSFWLFFFFFSGGSSMRIVGFFLVILFRFVGFLVCLFGLFFFSSSFSGWVGFFFLLLLLFGWVFFFLFLFLVWFVWQRMGDGRKKDRKKEGKKERKKEESGPTSTVVQVSC